MLLPKQLEDCIDFRHLTSWLVSLQIPETLQPDAREFGQFLLGHMILFATSSYEGTNCFIMTGAGLWQRQRNAPGSN